MPPGFGETERIADAAFDMARSEVRVNNFNRIRDTLLTPAGVTEKQVQGSDRRSAWSEPFAYETMLSNRWVTAAGWFRVADAPLRLRPARH